MLGIQKNIFPKFKRNEKMVQKYETVKYRCSWRFECFLRSILILFVAFKGGNCVRSSPFCGTVRPYVLVLIYMWPCTLNTNSLTENGTVRGESLKKAEMFYGYLDIFGHPKWISERYRVCMMFFFPIMGQIWSSKLGHNFFVFQIFGNYRVIFAFKSC